LTADDKPFGETPLRPAEELPYVLRHEDIESAGAELIKYGCEASIQPATYDLRVGTVVREGRIFNENSPGAEQAIHIEPGEIVTIITAEELAMPDYIAAVAFAMNKWSSQGLLVLNPGHIDPGFRGPLSVKALNLRKTKIALNLKEPIFTVMFFNLGVATGHPYPGPPRTRKQYEDEFVEKDLERTPTSISDLLRAAPHLPFIMKNEAESTLRNLDLPYMRKEQVELAIRNHWITRTTFWAAIIAAFFAVMSYVAIK
jgi:deoxycytidine triphosphate deaminase